MLLPVLRVSCPALAFISVPTDPRERFLHSACCSAGGLVCAAAPGTPCLHIFCGMDGLHATIV